MNKIFLSCLIATEMVEKKFHFILSFRERIQLKMHLALCQACMRYKKQSQFLEKGIEASLKVNRSLENTEQLEEQIIEKLSEKY